MTDKLTLVVSSAGTGTPQLSIRKVDENGAGTGYRLAGPSFSGSGKVLLDKTLDADDAAEIRSYLDEVFPRDELELAAQVLSASRALHTIQPGPAEPGPAQPAVPQAGSRPEGGAGTDEPSTPALTAEPDRPLDQARRLIVQAGAACTHLAAIAPDGPAAARQASAIISLLSQVRDLAAAGWQPAALQDIDMAVTARTGRHLTDREELREHAPVRAEPASSAARARETAQQGPSGSPSEAEPQQPPNAGGGKPGDGHLVELDGKTVPLTSCDWVEWAPCGCPVGTAMAGFEGDVFTEEDVWKAFYPRKEDRELAQLQGYRWELMTRERWSAEVADRMSAGCPYPRRGAQQAEDGKVASDGPDRAAGAGGQPPRPAPDFLGNLAQGVPGRTAEPRRASSRPSGRAPGRRA